MSQFPVAPGVVTPLTGALAAGSTIINNSSSVAVWIDSQPAVMPGVGVRLGPKGSLSWSNAGAAAYACTDTGATATATLTVTNDMADPVNPVDIGVAVATQLLNQGVPSVLTGSGLDATPAFGFTGMDVSGYASITISLTFLTAGATLAYGYYDPASGARIAGRTFVIADTGPFSFSAPVKMPNFYMSVTGGITFKNQWLYGSNRVLDETVIGISPGAVTGSTQAYVSGTSVQWTGSFTTNGGPHMLRWVLTGSGTGLLGVTFFDVVGGAMNTFYLADSKEGHVSPGGATLTELHESVILPPGVLKFTFLPYLTGTYQSLINIVPAS